MSLIASVPSLLGARNTVSMLIAKVFLFHLLCLILLAQFPPGFKPESLAPTRPEMMFVPSCHRSLSVCTFSHRLLIGPNLPSLAWLFSINVFLDIFVPSWIPIHSLCSNFQCYFSEFLPTWTNFPVMKWLTHLRKPRSPTSPLKYPVPCALALVTANTLRNIRNYDWKWTLFQISLCYQIPLHSLQKSWLFSVFSAAFPTFLCYCTYTW